VIDPVSLEDYRVHGGYAGLENALPMEPAAIVKQVTDSGLRAARRRVSHRHQMADGARCAGAQKYIVCNAMRATRYLFDRLLMEVIRSA